MKLEEAILRCIAENKDMSSGYIADKVMTTLKLFLDHNLTIKVDDASHALILGIINEDHMP